MLNAATCADVRPRAWFSVNAAICSVVKPPKRKRSAGSRVFVNIHIELDGDQTLREAHAIGASLRRSILAAYPQTDVIILTHDTREGTMNAALAQMQALPTVLAPITRIRKEELN